MAEENNPEEPKPEEPKPEEPKPEEPKPEEPKPEEPKPEERKSIEDIIKELTEKQEADLRKIKCEYERQLDERDEIIKNYINGGAPEQTKTLTVSERINANRIIKKW